jgi:hypothetical protein
MRPILFRCPTTGHQVQTMVADDVPDDAGSFVTVSCTACSRSHLVNAGTGNVAGSKRSDNRK